MLSLLRPIASLTNQLVNRLGFALRQVRVPQRPWWIKIRTQNPACTYFFGPFESRAEAAMAQFGYIEDLEQENAQGIRVDIGQFSPQQLTLDEASLPSLDTAERR